jgi:glycosyltransferase involved in cell wall biosynthesis
LESALSAIRPETAPSLVAVSSATQDLWSRRIPVSRVIRNGIDLDRWPAGPGGETLLWSGRIVREKAPHLAIDAAARAGREIGLAGPVADSGYWRAEVAPRLGDRARYLGHLTHDQLATRVGASGALLVTPMWEEPFCLAAAEAMASGTPVAGFARGGLPEVVGESGGVLTMPGDVGGLATAIGLALDCPRDAVRHHAGRTLALDRVGEEHERLYEYLAAPARAGSPLARWRRRRSTAPIPAPASA